MIRLSQIVGVLASAYIITGDDNYVSHAFAHAKAWFVDTATIMNPSLLYAQAIQGRATGRGIGIIDTIHLIEVAQGLLVMQKSNIVDQKILLAIKNWFSKYLVWLTSHQYGIDEMNAKNNHGTCWVMQVAVFARYTGRADLIEICRRRVKEVLLPTQMAVDGSFPLELARTKPYGYSLFNLDAMAMTCELLSTSEDNLWTFELPDGRGMRRALAFMVPYIEDKRRWPHKPDVMYFDGWPIRHTSLLFGALALKHPEYLTLWKRLNPDPREDEIIRNYIARQPILWM